MKPTAAFNKPRVVDMSNAADKLSSSGHGGHNQEASRIAAKPTQLSKAERLALMRESLRKREREKHD